MHIDPVAPFRRREGEEPSARAEMTNGHMSLTQDRRAGEICKRPEFCWLSMWRERQQQPLPALPSWDSAL